MPVESVTNSATAGAPSSITGTASLVDNFDTFLTLLTTQLQHQDPLSPMDSTEFTNQLTQFSQVEQAIMTNANLDDLLSLSQANQTLAAANYIGKTIEANGSTALLQDGTATMLVDLPTGVEDATVNVFNSTGEIIAALPISAESGPHTVVWNGKNSAGIQQPDGTYNFQVAAYDAANVPISGIDTAFMGIVSGVTTDDQGTLLKVGSSVVPLADVIAVHDNSI